MKKILLASVALFGFAGAASAADLPVRSAPPLPMIAAVPASTWTGFYVGVNAGYGWQGSNDNSIFVPAGTFVTAPAASGVVTYGDNEGDGFVGGGQVGYNYQIGQIVLGVEADLQWADLGGDNGVALVPAGFPPSFVPAGTAGGLEWLGTVRARVGFAFDRALIYATGGFAFADDATGWTVGGGVEYAFTNNLTLGLEGRWVNLNGDDNGTFLGTETVAGAVQPVYAATSNNDRDNEFFIARAKLNFKFSTY